jgi:hypothetical protein
MENFVGNDEHPLRCQVFWMTWGCGELRGYFLVKKRSDGFNTESTVENV